MKILNILLITLGIITILLGIGLIIQAITATTITAIIAVKFSLGIFEILLGAHNIALGMTL